MAYPKAPADDEVSIIHLPNMLRLKIGPRFGTLNPSKIAKAEKTLTDLSGQLESWMDAELEKLNDTQAILKITGLNPQVIERLRTYANDLKGLSVNYEFPIVSRIATSLCILIDRQERQQIAETHLINSHVDAIRACIRDRIRTADHPIGKALAETLEQQVAA